MALLTGVVPYDQGDIQFFLGNTVEGIRSAVRKGADMVEFDVPEIAADNIERPGPRNRDWTPEECAKFVADSVGLRDAVFTG